MQDLRRRLAVARGDEPADLVVRGGHVLSVFTKEWLETDVAAGHQADLLVLPELERFVPDVVLKAGRPVPEFDRPAVPDWVRQTVRLAPLGDDPFGIGWSDGTGEARGIGIVPGQIVTEAVTVVPTVVNGEVVADAASDTAKLAVLERHLGTGRSGLGLVRGLGLREGALASSFSHDAHNLAVAGMDDASMRRAVERLAELGGGMVVTSGEAVLAELPLPIAGIVSDQPFTEVVVQGHAIRAAARDLGCELDSPFQTLAFLALSVIPELKLTDRGLVDVDRSELVPLEL